MHFLILKKQGKYLMQVTMNKIMALQPCPEYTRDRVKKLLNGRKSLTLLEISELDIPFFDRLWAITELLKDSHTRELRLFGCDCAEHVLPIFEEKYPNDRRPREAIAVARRYADGEATKAELDVACDNAWSAARDAAWGAQDASDAVLDATRAAARAARAAWDDARAARAAARAARDAALGARQKEEQWQFERLQQMIMEIDG